MCVDSEEVNYITEKSHSEHKKRRKDTMKPFHIIIQTLKDMTANLRL